MTITASSPPQLQQFLCFQLHQTQAMLPTSQLTEILSLNLAQIISIPDLSPALMGVCNWRGEVLWLADLGYLLGFEPLYAELLHQAQVNTLIIHHQGQMLGLAVSRINQMQWCNSEQIQPPHTPQLSPQLARCLTGYWPQANHEMALMLDGTIVMACLQE
jgi:positive phototaxis protein PixI